MTSRAQDSMPRRTPRIGDRSLTDSGSSVSPPSDTTSDGQATKTTSTSGAEPEASAYTLRQLRERRPVPQPATAAPFSPRARLPEPTEMGAIIGFQRQFAAGEALYSYTAIKTPKGWHCTGSLDGEIYTWSDLLAWIDAAKYSAPAPIWLAADWVEISPEGNHHDR